MRAVLLALALVFAAGPLPAQEELNRVTLVRIGDRDGTLRLVLETAREPQAQVYLRSKPDRIVVELLGTTLPREVRKPAPSGPWLTSSTLAQENLSRVRWTLTPRHRIPLTQIKTEVLDNPHRVVVDIDPYYDREETFAVSSAIRWVRRETAGP
ncbi:MAG: AMIN domain-containing protein, partial [Candidatus Eremiobacterota bacterium]